LTRVNFLLYPLERQQEVFTEVIKPISGCSNPRFYKYIYATKWVEETE